MASRSETHIGVILPQEYTVFGSRCKHSVRLVYPFGHKVIDKHSDICLVAREGKRLGSLHTQSGVGSGHKPLPRGFLITGGAVDLTCKIEPFDELRLKCVMKLRGVKKSYSIA